MARAGGLALDPTVMGRDETSVLVLASSPRDRVDDAVISALAPYETLRLCPSGDIADLGAHDAVLATGASGPLPPDAQSGLERYMRAGGTLVALGRACDSWMADGLGHVIGVPAPGPRAPTTNLRIRPTPDSALTRRLDTSFIVRDSLRLQVGAPEGATTLLTADWHLTRPPVAFTRRIGDGVFVYLGLDEVDGGSGSNVIRLLHRCLRHAEVVARPHRPLGVGLLGYGAIAGEHAAAIAAVPGLELAGVCDLSEERRRHAQSHLGVTAHVSPEALLEDGAVDVVVVGTPPDSHASLSIRCLAAGKHVVCEKPLALRAADVDLMIATATDSRRVLTTYQNRRWDPDFVALRQAVAGGAIGEPFYVEMFVGGYGQPCPYWHSHEAVSGGTLFDWGSHYMDWILRLIGSPVMTVRATAHKRVWFDVSNSDQVRVDLMFAGGAEASFIHSDIAAALKPKWYVLGTRGALVGDWRFEALRSRGPAGELVEHPLSPADSPANLRLLRPDRFGGSSEETLSLPPRRAEGFYSNLADHLLFEEKLEAPAEQGRAIVAIMEAATESIARGVPVRPDI